MDIVKKIDRKRITTVLFSVVFVALFFNVANFSDIDFQFGIKKAHAQTLFFHEGCASNPQQTDITNSTDIIVGTGWNSRVTLVGTPTQTFLSGTTLCNAGGNSNNIGFGNTVDPVPSTDEYYMDYLFVDGGAVGVNASFGALLNYIDTNNYYACFTEDDTTPDVVIVKVSGGTGSVLVENTNQTIDSGDNLECRIDYTGANPTITLTNVTDTATLATYTDSTSPLTSTRGTGIFCGATPTAKTADDCDVDIDFDEVKFYYVGTPDPPTVTTDAATAVDTDSATLNGDITAVSENAEGRGFAYSTDSTLTTGVSTTTEYGDFGTGTFTYNASSLSSNTTYYFRAYASSTNAGYGYGTIENFTTDPDPPTVVTNAASSVTSDSATLNGNITVVDENAEGRGFAYSTDSTLTTGVSTTTEYGDFGTGTFTFGASSLDPGTTYYFRAYASSTNAGFGYGTIENFTTDVVIPTVTTNAATGIGSDDATLNGNITDTGGENAGGRGFAYSTNSTLSSGVSTTTNFGSFGSGAFAEVVASLDPNTTYYFRAYATNTAGFGYGTILNFTTLADPPTVTTNAATGIGSDDATLNGNITDTGGENAGGRGFAYSTNSTLSSGVSTTTNFGDFGTGAFNEAIASLDPNTTYYFRAYATNTGGFGYGTILNFTTDVAPPTVTTNAASGIGQNDATLNGNITATGGENAGGRGFAYSTNSTLSSSVSTTTNFGSFGTGAFNEAISSLDPNTTYYFRAYATNTAGFGYGTILSFNTDAVLATLELGTHRWFQNLDATEPGLPALLNQSIITPEQGNPFRLRLNLHVEAENLTIGNKTQKLQFGEKIGATCEPSGDETYADITTGSAIAYYDNPSVSDNAAISSHSFDPTHSSTTVEGPISDILNLQNYNDGTTDTTFTNAESAINIGEDGLWDFSLMDNSAPAGTSYCIRVVDVGGGLIDDYGSSTLPEIRTRREVGVRLVGQVVLRNVRLNGI